VILNSLSSLPVYLKDLLLSVVSSMAVIGSTMNLMPHLVHKAYSLSIVHLLSCKLGAVCYLTGRRIRLFGNGSDEIPLSIM
jgi:hypothetical protein